MILSRSYSASWAMRIILFHRTLYRSVYTAFEP